MPYRIQFFILFVVENYVVRFVFFCGKWKQQKKINNNTTNNKNDLTDVLFNTFSLTFSFCQLGQAEWVLRIDVVRFVLFACSQLLTHHFIRACIKRIAFSFSIYTTRWKIIDVQINSDTTRKRTEKKFSFNFSRVVVCCHEKKFAFNEKEKKGKNNQQVNIQSTTFSKTNIFCCLVCVVCIVYCIE